MLDNHHKQQYQQILDEMQEPQAENNTSRILSRLEAIADRTDDLMAIFSKDASLLERPAFLIDIVRLIRFSSRLKRELTSQYDVFVTSYQQLSTMPARDEDEEKLFEEIGALMYQIDDQGGRHERLSDRILKTIIRSISDFLRGQEEEEEVLSIHNSPVRDDLQLRFRPLVEEMLSLCADLAEQIEIMQAISRMRDLIMRV